MLPNPLAVAQEALTRGDQRQARALLVDALLEDPQNLALVSLLAITLRREGDYPAAKACADYVLRRAPHHLQASTTRALLHLDANEPSAAVGLLEANVARQPLVAGLWSNLGLAYRKLGRISEAVEAYQRSLELTPNQITSWCQLGLCFRRLGNFEAAIRCLRHCCTLDPHHAEHHFNLALALLQCGAFTEGWKEYHWRLARTEPRTLIPVNERSPKHMSVIQHRRVVLVAEQGLGDTIQFIRFGPMLRPWVRELHLCVPDKLSGLCARLDCWDSIVEPMQARCLQAQGAIAVPLLSLPGILQAEPPFNTGQAYVQPAKEQVALWRERLMHDHPHERIVGLNWQGNPLAEQEDGFQGRSIALEQLAPLAEVPGIQFVALQKGPGSEQLQRCSFQERFVAAQNVISECWDFCETSAIAAACDLVVTVDTALAHLSGAIGQDTWVLLQAIPEWRWGTAGDRTPWYGTMRLFRQPRPSDWTSVVLAVQRELNVLQTTNKKAGP